MEFHKVYFDLSGTSWGEMTESLNAVHCGDANFVLDNSPFHAYGVSYKDVVQVKIIDERFFFDKVVKRGGHSTLRVFFKISDPNPGFIKDQLQPFVDMGCGYEGDGKRLYAINVPPETDIEKVIQLLKDGENIGKWEYEEACVYRPVTKVGNRGQGQGNRGNRGQEPF